MADATEERYTIKEISVASGIPVATLNSRRKRMGMEGNDEGYTLAEAKLLVRRPRRGRPFSQGKANRLRQKLQNDGFTCK